MMLLRWIYFLLLFTGMAAAIWKMVMIKPAIGSDDGDLTTSTHTLKTGLMLLAIYIGINLCAELYVTFALGRGTQNHFVYAINALLNSAVMLSFFCVITRKKLLIIYAIVAIVLETIYFVKYSLWQPMVLISSEQMIGYHGAIALGCLLYLWYLITNADIEPHRSMLWLGGIIFTYYMAGLLVIASNFAQVNVGNEHLYIFWVTNALSYLFYAVLAFTIINIPSQKKVATYL